MLNRLLPFNKTWQLEHAGVLHALLVKLEVWDTLLKERSLVSHLFPLPSPGSTWLVVLSSSGGPLNCTDPELLPDHYDTL